MSKLLILLVFCIPVFPARAQDAQDSPDNKVYVAFRIQNWKTRHIHDASQAEKFLATLKTLGCEVKTNQHNGHTDVSCRTIFWKTLALDSHDKAHEWINWFHSVGFDTIHGHVVGNAPNTKNAGANQAEVVQYKLADWKTQHLENSAELNQLLALYRGMGIEVKVSSHDGHHDVTARCQDWMEINLPSHDAANKWQQFLKENGFETKHVHRH